MAKKTKKKHFHVPSDGLAICGTKRRFRETPMKPDEIAGTSKLAERQARLDQQKRSK